VAALANAVKAANTARILYVDIERLPGMVPIFDQKTSGFIPVSRWTRLPSLLCFAAKWKGTRKVEFAATWDGHEAMVQKSWDLYDQADIVVTFNGKRFDNPHLRGAWLLAGLPPPRPWKDVDLFQVSKKYGFESRSLAHLCHMLGIQGKSGHYDPAVAERCIEGDPKAQREMQTYNTRDARINEEVHVRLLGDIHNHPHVSTSAADEIRCNRCGGDDFDPLPTPYRAVVLEYPMYRCKNCGGIVKTTHSSRRIARTQGVQ
jgi:DNA-directed RNA polymerase subunit RPC12/RpoP